MKTPSGTEAFFLRPSCWWLAITLMAGTAGLLAGFYIINVSRRLESNSRTVTAAEPVRMAKSFIAPVGQIEHERVFQNALDDLRSGRSEDSSVLHEIIGRWLVSDPIGCINTLSETPARFLIETSKTIDAIRGVSERNPELGLSLASQIKWGDLRKAVVKAEAARLANVEPRVALSAISRLPEELRIEARGHFLETLIEKEKRVGLEKLLAEPNASQNDLYAATDKLAKIDPEAAVALLKELDQRLSVRGHESVSSETLIGATLKNLSPARNIEFLSSFPAGLFRDRQMIYALSQLVADQPAKIDEVLRTISDDIPAADLLSMAAIKASHSNIAGAQTLLDRIPGQLTRQRTAMRIAYSVANDKQKLDSWVEGITDPLTRSQVETAFGMEKTAGLR